MTFWKTVGATIVGGLISAAVVAPLMGWAAYKIRGS